MKTTEHVCSIIMIVTTLLIVFPSFWFICSMDWKAKEDKPFMVALPKGGASAPDFLEILLEYKRKIRVLFYVMAAITPLYWFLGVMEQVGLMTAVIFGFLIIPPVFGRKARKDLISLKKEKGWTTHYTAIHRRELRLGGKKVSRRWYMLAFAAGLLFPVLWVGWTAARHSVPDFSVIMSVMLTETVIITAAFWQRRKYRTWKKEVTYPNDFCSSDEDDYWHMGMLGLYYDNPYDSAVLKNNNSGGLNMNLNRARLGSWIFWIVVWAVIVAPLAYSFVYPQYVDWNGQLADIRIIEGNILQVEGKFYQAEIPLDALEAVKLISSIEELGDGVRTMGTGSYAYGKGRFQYEKAGTVMSYTAYRHPPFLLITVGEADAHTTYLLNDDDSQVTKAVYQELAGRLGR